MTAIDTHRTALQWAAYVLDVTMTDASVELTHWTPPGIANPIAACYAHAICGSDAIIHSMLQPGVPLYAAEWAGKTGISEPRMDQTFEWARSVTVNLEAARPYAQAVFAAASSFIDSLSESDLARELDLSAVGLDTRA